MAIKDVFGKVQEVTGSAAESAGKFLDEFNEALPTLRALGFTIKDLRIGMGLLPEVGAKLIASIESIDVKKIDELVEKQKEKKTLVALLKALQTAYTVKQQLGAITFSGVQIDMKLGLPPHIDVAFVSSTDSSASTSASAAAH